MDIPIVGDVKNVLSEMIQLWGKQESAPAADSLDKWWKSIEEWRSRNCLWFDNESEIIKPQYVIQKLAEITNNSAIITSDVVNTKCLPPNITHLSVHANGSIPAV